MSFDPQLMRLLQQLYGHIVWQNEKMYSLELLLSELRDEIRALRLEPATRVDKIEYTFDQLKVETLEGTLQIGITPEGVKSLEDMAIGGKPQVQTPLSAEPESEPVTGDDASEGLRQNAEAFVRVHVPVELLRLESEFGPALSDRERCAVIDDLLHQTVERVRAYWRLEKAARAGSRMDDAADKILERLRREVLIGLRQYVRERSEKEGMEP